MEYTSYDQTTTVAAPPRSENNLEKIMKENLPPLPGSVFRIMELMRDVNVTTTALAQAVGNDPLLAVRLLRLANSSYYSQQNDVTTLKQAIDTIGMKALYDAVMLGVAANTFSKEIGSEAGLAIWEHSLAVALVSRELTNASNMRGAENAFICGLLHDIGKFVLLKADSDGYKKLSERKEDDEMLNSEDEYYGINHAELGALLTKRWNLPNAIADVILYHHEPAKTPQAIFMSHVINTADDIARVNGYGPCAESRVDALMSDEVAYLHSESIVALRLTQTQMIDIWVKITPHLSEVLSTFTRK